MAYEISGLVNIIEYIKQPIALILGIFTILDLSDSVLGHCCSKNLKWANKGVWTGFELIIHTYQAPYQCILPKSETKY